MEEGSYLCVCIQGWAGSDCSIPLEMNCNDDIDNDHGMFLVKINTGLFIIFSCNRWYD